MRRVTAAVSAVVSAVVSASLAAFACGPPATATGHHAVRRVPPPLAVFNVPSGPPEEQNAIAAHVDRLAAGAPSGSLIRIAVYHFTSSAFAQTLIDAKNRGVRVRLVLDASAGHGATYRRLAQALGTSRARPSWVTTCRRGCAGTGIMHNKFFLFSRAGSDRDVVVQSSANLTTSNRVNAWNNAVTLSDPTIYGAYVRYFDALADRRHYGYHVTHSGKYTLYTFPRAGRTRKTDTLYELLGHVGCAARTSVHMTTFFLTRVDVARRLWSLARQGCDVRIIYTNLSRAARRILTRAGGPHLLGSHYGYLNMDTARAVEAYVHSKYVAIGGTYAGHERRLVITGSPNATRPGLRANDEAMLRIEDAETYDAYAGNFARLWRIATDRIPLGGHVKEN